MGMDVMDLIIHLRFEGTCDWYLVRHSGKTAPSLGEESTDKGEATDKGEDFEWEPMEEGDPEVEAMEEEVPEEGFSEGGEEIIGEEDPEEDLKGDPKGDLEEDPEEYAEEDPEEDLAEDRVEHIHEGYIGAELEDPRAESGVPDIKGVSIRVR